MPLTISPRQRRFIDSLNPNQRAMHEALAASNVEYHLMFQQLSTDTAFNLLLSMINAAVDQDLDPAACELVDLEDHSERRKYLSTPPGRYLDVQIAPPREIAAFLAGENAGDLTRAQLEKRETAVLSWLYKHYEVPEHLAFRLDHSDILIGAGIPAPVEIWLTRSDLAPARP